MERPGRLKRRPPPPSLLICLFLVALTCLMIDPCSCSDGELNLFFLFFLFFPHWFASRMEIAQLEPPTVGSRESKGMRWWWCHQFNNINFILVVCERRKKEEEEEEDSVERWINRKGKQLFLSLAKFFFSFILRVAPREEHLQLHTNHPQLPQSADWWLGQVPFFFFFDRRVPNRVVVVIINNNNNTIMAAWLSDLIFAVCACVRARLYLPALYRLDEFKLPELHRRRLKGNWRVERRKEGKRRKNKKFPCKVTFIRSVGGSGSAMSQRLVGRMTQLHTTKLLPYPCDWWALLGVAHSTAKLIMAPLCIALACLSSDSLTDCWPELQLGHKKKKSKGIAPSQFAISHQTRPVPKYNFGVLEKLHRCWAGLYWGLAPAAAVHFLLYLLLYDVDSGA